MVIFYIFFKQKFFASCFDEVVAATIH